MRYRPEIDGLRAIAVIPVIFYHAGFELFSGGFIGVDVFFVLSGYLITSILLGEHESGNESAEQQAGQGGIDPVCLDLLVAPRSERLFTEHYRGVYIRFKFSFLDRERLF